MKIPFPFALLAFFTLLFAGSCSNDGSSGNPCESDFDQAAMFQHVADNIILPEYESFLAATTALRAAKDAFTGTPTLENLMALRAAYRVAYLQWQAVAQYEFGPAESRMLRARLNNFPADVPAIEAKLAVGDLSLNQPGAYDKGFPALDYLLFGLADDDQDILAELSAAGNEAYLAYLSAIIDDAELQAEAVLKSWKEEGYRDTFVSLTGTAAGTALSLLVNNLNEHFELIKRDKLGIPAGVVTLGFTNPDKVEALYSGLSLELAVAATRASEQLYLGRSAAGANGPGLDDYLQAVGATKEGEDLDALIQQQFAAAIEALEKVSPPLAEAVDADNASTVEAYNALTRQVVNIKTDLPSVLCVSITYIDNPSDSD